MNVRERLERIEWEGVATGLWEKGFARLPAFLTQAQCVELRSLYAEPAHFRSRVVMERYRFGRGEYQYFRYPLPPLVQSVREDAYPHLAPIANEFAQALRLQQHFPMEHQALIAACRAQGQSRPTALLLKYGPGDYNCLHQDLYGPLVFPFQMTLFLSEPGREFRGGDFVLVENRPRAQSVASVLEVEQGDAVVFTTRYRPMRTKNGFARAAVRHGVSELTQGERYALGIIFHDAS